ncbi:hypothetical protein [Aquimarina longa]|uniref:hypothetical protein n=1 Tax=Aquimarina longa TaxID=1080221 RepID=UPI000783FD83|nr:hypothetical protein [Aquimarina longa]
MNKEIENKEEILIKDRDRLKVIMRELNINTYGLYKALGYKNQGSVTNIGKVVNGRKVKMGAKFIERLIKKFPQVSMKYAKYGKGEVILSGKAKVAQMNALGLGTDSERQLTFEQETRILLEEINKKLDLLLEKNNMM